MHPVFVNKLGIEFACWVAVAIADSARIPSEWLIFAAASPRRGNLSLLRSSLTGLPSLLRRAWAIASAFGNTDALTCLLLASLVVHLVEFDWFLEG